MFLKLHGSIDWYSLAEWDLNLMRDAGLTIDGYLHMVAPGVYLVLDPFRHPEFGGDLTNSITLQCVLMKDYGPAILVPSERKSISEFSLNDIWASAWNVLTRSRNIVIVGYSLPENDQHSRALLRNSIVKRHQQGDQTRLILVAPDKDRSLYIKYSNLLGSMCEIASVNHCFEKVKAREILELIEL
ncbi:MAG: hypothetical protein E3J89_01960 [Candidatus Aminicenantes bacterium]|nr:MAG: hypothetical protein E3J89_01960 [Candidatus Aminicenantes bacterium]